MIEGELALRLGPEGEPCRAPAGTLVLVPPGVIHSFANESSGEVRYLNLHAPSMRFIESLHARRLEGYDPTRFDAFDPPADGGVPARRVRVSPPDEADSITLGESRAVFKAGVENAGGHLSLTETVVAPGFPGPVPHRHDRLVDSFYILDGVPTLRLGDDSTEIPPGSFAFVPPGNVHTFSNPGSEPVRMLNLMAPGGFERYLREVAAAMRPGDPPDPALMATIASRYDFHPA